MRPCRVWLLLRRRLSDVHERLLALAPVLVCPVLLFYSRTFMIESTALCLTVWFTFFFETILSRARSGSLLATWLTGALATLTKLTTFAAFWIFLAILVIERIRIRRRNGQSWVRATTLTGALALLAIGVPFAAELTWLHYSDHLKEIHPYAHALTSYAPGFRSFNLGTLVQRITFDWWKQIGHITVNQVLALPGFLTLLGGLFLIAAPYRRMALVCTVSYAGGFLLFSNLYYIHDYYFYASVLFLLLAFGIVSAGLLRSRWIHWGCALVPNHRWPRSRVERLQPDLLFLLSSANDPIPFEAEIIRRLSYADEVFAGFGYDWSSLLPYSAQRRAIMPFISASMNFEALDRSLTQLNKRQLSTVIVTGYFRKEYPFIGILKTKLQLTSEPVIITPDADIYVRKDRAAGVATILSSRSDWGRPECQSQPDAGMFMVLRRYDLRTQNWLGRFSMTSPVPFFSRGPVEIGILTLDDNKPAISTQTANRDLFPPACRQPFGQRQLAAWYPGLTRRSYHAGRCSHHL